jgi:two-component system response regulator NreC
VLRILVVDDVELVRRGIVSLLKHEPGWQVTGEAANGAEAVEKARELQCDVILLDIRLPDMNGLLTARQIHQDAPNAEILFLSHDNVPQLIIAALEAGARGYVCKTDIGRELLDAVRAAAHHRRFFSSSCSLALPQLGPYCRD